MVWHCLALKQFCIKNVGPAKIQMVQQKIPGCWTYVQQNENKFQKVCNEGTDFSYLYRWWWTKNIFNFFTFSNIGPILKYKWKIFISQIKIFITNEKKMVFIFNLIAYLTKSFFPWVFLNASPFQLKGFGRWF